MEPREELLGEDFQALWNSASYKDAALWYVEAYESQAFDQHISVKIEAAPAAGVLFLSSYSTINWDLEGRLENIAAIVVYSHSPGTQIFNAPANVPVLYLDRNALPYAEKEESPVESEDADLQAMQRLIADTFDEVSLGYDVAEVTIPN